MPIQNKRLAEAGRFSLDVQDTEGDRPRSIERVAIDYLMSCLDQAVEPTAYRKGSAQRADVLSAFIERHQQTTGAPPTTDDLHSRFATYGLPDQYLDARYLADELARAYRRSDLVTLVNRVSLAVRDDDIEVAERMVDGYAPTVTGQRLGRTLSDPDLYVVNDSERMSLPSLGPVMEPGVMAGELVLISARTGVGKSWLLLMAAMDALKQGWDVTFLSLEMLAPVLASRAKILLRGVHDNPPAWFAEQPGQLSVIDESDVPGGMTTRRLRSLCEGRDRHMLVVDYGELLRPDSGGRSSESHTKSAEISEALQNLSNAVGQPILAAAQDNRQAVYGGTGGVEQLSGSDRWGRDADTVLRLLDPLSATISSLSPGQGPTRTLVPIKSRHSPGRTPSHFVFNTEKGVISLVSRNEYAMANEAYIAKQDAS